MDLPIFGDKTQEGYALPDFYFMSQKEKNELHAATKDVWDIFCKFNKLLRQADDDLMLVIHETVDVYFQLFGNVLNQQLTLYFQDC